MKIGKMERGEREGLRRNSCLILDSAHLATGFQCCTTVYACWRLFVLHVELHRTHHSTTAATDGFHCRSKKHQRLLSIQRAMLAS